MRVGAVWKLPGKEAAKIHPAFGCGVEAFVTECGEYWFATKGECFREVGEIVDHGAVCDIDVKQEPDEWELLRLMIRNDQIGLPTYGSSPFSKVCICSTCKREKDTGKKCWWCGN
jgi:hypothetical protein